VPLALLCAAPRGAAIKHLTASKFDHANNSKYARAAAAATQTFSRAPRSH